MHLEVFVHQINNICTLPELCHKSTTHYTDRASSMFNNIPRKKKSFLRRPVIKSKVALAPSADHTYTRTHALQIDWAGCKSLTPTR